MPLVDWNKTRPFTAPSNLTALANSNTIHRSLAASEGVSRRSLQAVCWIQAYSGNDGFGLGGYLISEPGRDYPVAGAQQQWFCLFFLVLLLTSAAVFAVVDRLLLLNHRDEVSWLRRACLVTGGPQWWRIGPTWNRFSDAASTKTNHRPTYLPAWQHTRFSILGNPVQRKYCNSNPPTKTAILPSI